MATNKPTKEVDITTALRLKEALVLLSQTLNIEFCELAARICLFEKEKHDILKQASDLWNHFNDADIVGRGKILGYNITLIETNLILNIKHGKPEHYQRRKKQ